MSFTPDQALDYLVKAFKAGRLGHAYLVTGPEGCGKQTLASKLIALTNNMEAKPIEQMLGDRVRLLEPQSKSRTITIDSMREFERSFYLASGGGGLKIGIIRDADRLQPQSANAFLKTLEEPPPKSLFLLLTALPEQLLETILSRCIRVQLRSASRQRVFNDDETLLLAAIEEQFGRGGGTSVGSALALKQKFADIMTVIQKEITDKFKAEEKAEVAKFKDIVDADWRREREKHFQALGKSEYLMRRQRLLDLLFSWVGDAVRLKSNYTRVDIPQHQSITAAIAKNNTPDQLARRLQGMEHLHDLLRTNVSESLMLEVCFLEAFG